jgi:hypothetical protein
LQQLLVHLFALAEQVLELLLQLLLALDEPPIPQPPL